MRHIRMATCALALCMPALLCAATPPAAPGIHPRLEHLAVWVKDLDKTAKFLDEALG